MCGIAGVLELPGSSATAHQALADVRTMMGMLRHRGPDGAGVFQDSPVSLGHRRLVIVDPDGWQPMCHPSRRYTLVFNGEIYNAAELRRGLLSRGHSFRTRSDTEVLLQLFAERQDACLELLNGMYAFAVWDAQARRLFLARDRFGIKPLYLARLPDRVLFASEIKALLPLLPQVRLNEEALRDYLHVQQVLEDRTFFQGVTRLEPGSAVWIGETGEVQQRRFWTPDFQVDPTLTLEAATSAVSRLLNDAVRLNLTGDVLVGATLSGGLDSSSVVMIARELSTGPLPAFTGTFREGPAYDETPYARQVASAAQLELHEHAFGPEDLIGALEPVAYALDEPCAGPGALPQFLVAREARAHVRVLLGGQGGDELFGGYARYLVAYLEECLRGAIFGTHTGGPFVVTFESILPNLPLLKPYLPLLAQQWQQGLFGPMDERYLRLMRKFPGIEGLLTADARQRLLENASGGLVPFGEAMRRDFNHPELGSLINRMMWVDLRHFLPGLLQVEDRMSMAHGLESRVPLLDHRLVELLFKVPPTVKFAGGELKVLLKRAMQHLVPRSVLTRTDKLGFPVPLNLWAQGPMREVVWELVLGERARARGIFHPPSLEQAWQNAGAFDRTLWGMMALELWFRQYLDGAWREKVPSVSQLAQYAAEERIQL